MLLLSRLRAAVLEHALFRPGAAVVVGVSGGPDSVALLHALRTLAPDRSLQLHVAHLNHQLRGDEADADEEFVLALAREWGLPAASARWDVAGYASENGLSLEEAGRELRYRFLLGVAAQVGADAVAVGHNADDQVETVLLHLLRGAGLMGLRGMAYKSLLGVAEGDGREIALVRPLLDVTRAQIEAYCAEHLLQPRLDRTNLDPAILRNRLRLNVIPYLETINPNLREVLRHGARSLADDYEYIHQNVLGIFDRMARPANGALVFDLKWFRALPPNLQRGVLREAIHRFRRLKNAGWAQIEQARRTAAEKDAGAEATLPQGLVLVVGYGEFTIGETMPLPDAPLLLLPDPIPLLTPGERLLPESDWAVRVRESELPVEFAPGPWRAVFDAGRVHGHLVLRPRVAGERFAPAGMGGKHKSLHEFMIDARIPRHLRDLIPILADEEQVLWVCGYRTDERARPTAETTRCLDVEFFKT